MSDIDENLATPEEQRAYQAAADAARRPNQPASAPHVRTTPAAHAYITRFTTFGAERIDVSDQVSGTE